MNGLYEVSNLGNIRSFDCYIRQKNNSKALRKGKILKPHINEQNGYAYITLTKNKIIKSFKVHRIVAKTFIPNTENKSQVNHINGIKSDNNVLNLEWVTPSENQKHAYKMGLKSTTQKVLDKFNINRIDNSKKIKQLNLSGDLINIWDSISYANKVTNVDSAGISKCCNGKRKTAGGFKWEFAD